MAGRDRFAATGGVDEGGKPWHRYGTISELVSLSNNDAQTVLKQKLPPRSRIISASVKAATALAFDGDTASGTPAQLALLMEKTAAGTVTVSTDVIAYCNTTQDDAGYDNGTDARFQNTAEDTEQNLALAPCDIDGTNFLDLDVTTGASTADYAVNGTGQQAKVCILYEQTIKIDDEG